MSLVEALWRMGDLEREMNRAVHLRRELQRRILPPYGGLLVLPNEDREAAQALADSLGQALVSCGTHLGKIERELSALHAVR